jgi:hypothetical protein
MPPERACMSIFAQRQALFEQRQIWFEQQRVAWQELKKPDEDETFISQT